MTPFLLTLLWLIGAFLIIVLFLGAEVAFISANRLAIELRKKQGHNSGVILSKFLDEPHRFLGVCLIGATIGSVLFTIHLSKLLNTFLWNILEIESTPWLLLLNVLATAVIIVFLFYWLLKPIIKAKGDGFLMFFAGLLNFFYKIFNPIVAVVVNISAWLLKYIFNVNVSNKKDVLSKVDLEQFYQQHKFQDEDNQELNTELFENALLLPKVKIRQCLIPRTEVVGADVKLPLSEIKKVMIENKLSKLIIYKENIDNILGYVHQLDLFKNPTNINEVILPIPAVPESMSAMDLITKFSKERKSIAWVVDEFGGTAGIVSMADVLEEIFGEIRDEYDVEEFVAKQIAEDEYLFSGRLEIDYLNEKFNLELSANNSETLSGFIISEHETIPQQKERIIIDRFEFEILNVSDTRIEMVKMKVLG